MTEQDKQLLLKDLCGRLSYGLKVKVYDSDLIYTVVGIDLEKGLLRVVSKNIYSHVRFEHCTPYLRPMASMTEDEDMHRCAFLDDIEGGVEEAIPNYIDFLNENHFDYRGLIERDLALEAPEGMYNI